MLPNQSSVEVVDQYFSDPQTQDIIVSMETVRQKAYNSKWSFYKTYSWLVILVYCIIAYLTYVFNSELSHEFIFIMWISPGALYYNLGQKKQSSTLSTYKVSSQLFDHFIKTIFTDSHFDETNKYYTQEPTTSELFMTDYDEYHVVNSLSIPMFKNDQDQYRVEVQGSEVCFTKTKGHGKNRKVITDMGMLYRIIFNNPKRIIGSQVIITPNNNSRFRSKSNLVILEDQEFEQYFDVKSEDPIEARMILTSNVMNKLTEFIKQTSPYYYFRFVDNSFYIKRRIDTSFITMDRDTSIAQNKEAYINFYQEMKEIEKLVEALNVDYYFRP